ncbi:VOC family protein [Halobacillus sp. Cin3]|uniref:VOC family protein n=1 Tax=Halobacillus sp. Cin3 TaxID=2928441 RepID=UPI00248EBCD2|nr:VOC family protein [Halobacillus sp. Cin3]
MLERMDTFCLHVRHLSEARRWYERILNAQTAYQEEDYCVLTIGGGAPLTLEEGEVKPGSSYPIFYTKDYEGMYMYLQEKEVKVGAKKEDEARQYFDFYDLDGNKLQVCSYES